MKSTRRNGGKDMTMSKGRERCTENHYNLVMEMVGNRVRWGQIRLGEFEIMVHPKCIMLGDFKI
jgi:hypothetical protein